MLLRHALPAARQSLAHPFPIYEMGSKALEKILPIHKAQLLSYMKLLNVPVGLLINFHETKLTDGVSRLILPGANR